MKGLKPIPTCAAFAATSVSLLMALPHAVRADDSKRLRDHWFDGAEISRYDLAQFRYADVHPGHAELIFVTEPFLAEEQVKSDTPDPEAVDVLKVNRLRTFNTGVYSYRAMTSVFTPMFEPETNGLKVTLSVQDWCGQVFVQANRKGNTVTLRSFSYFEKEGDQMVKLVGETQTIYLEDNVWNQIRIDPARLPVGTFRAVPSLLYLRLQHQPLTAYKAVGRLEMGNNTSHYEVVYPRLGRTIRWAFDGDFPYAIQSWEEVQHGRDEATSATLEDRMMNAYYWEMNRPHHADERRELGLEAVAD